MKVLNFDGTIYEARAGSASQPGISFAGDPNTGIYSPGADQLAISTGGSGRLFIDANGRVGVGSSAASPSFPLDISSTSSFTGLRLIRTNNNNSLLFSVNSSDTIINAAGAGTASLTFQTENTERARIDSSGRLLVGTSSSTGPSYIQIEGNTAEGATGVGSIRLRRGTASPAVDQNLGAIVFADNTSNDGAYILGQRDGGTWSGSSKPTRLAFSTTADGASSPTERMRITNGGRLEAWGGSAVNSFNLVTQAAAGTTYYLIYGGHSSSGAGNYGTQSFGVWSNGNVINTNNSYGAISDLKLKENIVDASSQWDDIKSLQVRNYNFKEGQTHTQIGLVAQEVELVSPGLVSESPDRDEDGNDLGTVTKSVNYSVLYMKAVKALQEAMERIEQLEARLTAAGID